MIASDEIISSLCYANDCTAELEWLSPFS